MAKSIKTVEEVVSPPKDMGWLKSLLNNLPLLKWVRQYSADSLLDDNNKAKEWGVEVNDDSVSVLDSTQTKLLVTNSRFTGKEYSRYNIKHISDVLRILGSEGELVIGENKLLMVSIPKTRTTIVICQLPKQDREE